ncbi:MAG: hypothetical protein GF364_07105 [Candidatus Lokiarchaeota archaeon]|nr:hypothetical protein [Candidatus Lokiarchaeota archaeon]
MRQKIPGSNKILPYLYVITPIVIAILYFFVGFLIENGEIDFEMIIFGEVYTKYNYTLVECLLDIEQFLGLFINTIMYSLLFAGAILCYGLPKNEMENFSNYRDLSKKTKIAGIIALSILITSIILSILGLGISRPEWDGKTFVLMFTNFYPEFFSLTIFPFIIFASYSFIPYIFAKITRVGVSKWKPNKIGIYYLLGFLGLFQLLLISMPLNISEMFHADILRELLYRGLDLFIITGTILLIELKQRKIQFALEKRETKKQVAKNINRSQRKQDMLKNSNRFTKHGAILLLIFIATAVFTMLLFLLIKGNVNSEIGIGRLVSRIWVFGFEFAFTMFLYFLGMTYRKNNLLEELD